MRLVPGDRVRVKDEFDGESLPGWEGTVVLNHEHNDSLVGVQFDEPISCGHDCCGNAPNYPIYRDGYCWWGEMSELEFICHGEEIPPVAYREVKGYTHTPTLSKEVK